MAVTTRDILDLPFETMAGIVSLVDPLNDSGPRLALILTCKRMRDLVYGLEDELAHNDLKTFSDAIVKKYPRSKVESEARDYRPRLLVAQANSTFLSDIILHLARKVIGTFFVTCDRAICILDPLQPKLCDFVEGSIHQLESILHYPNFASALKVKAFMRPSQAVGIHMLRVLAHVLTKILAFQKITCVFDQEDYQMVEIVLYWRGIRPILEWLDGIDPPVQLYTGSLPKLLPDPRHIHERDIDLNIRTGFGTRSLRMNDAKEHVKKTNEVLRSSKCTDETAAEMGRYDLLADSVFSNHHIAGWQLSPDLLLCRFDWIILLNSYQELLAATVAKEPHLA